MRKGATALAVAMTLSAAACSSNDDGSKSSGSSGAGSSGAGSSNSSGASGSQGASGGSSAQPGSSNAPGLAAGKSIDIGGSGDILVHVPVRDDAEHNAAAKGAKGYDFDPMFANVTKPISALDLAICHMETPLSTTNTNLSIPATLSFNVPHEVAGSLKRAGFDGCDRVGNHVIDRGIQGVGETKKSLDAAGLKNQGPTPTPSTGQSAVMYDVEGVKVAQLAYSYTTANADASNTVVPPEWPWLKYWQFPVVKAEGILADAKKAKAAGADVVVLSMHWGKEYSIPASTEQRELAAKLLASDDVDTILGTHVHVPQSCEKINGKYVVYGMGNFLSNQGPSVNSSLKPSTQDGMIVDVKLTKGDDGKVTQQLTYQPTHVNLAGHVIELATPTKNADAYGRVKAAMTQLGSKCDATPAS